MTADRLGGRKIRVERIRRHVLSRRHAEGHPHPDRYWWHQAIADELRDYGPIHIERVGTRVCVDPGRYVASMVSWGEVEYVADGWVHLRGVSPNHGAHLTGAA